jgi:nitrogen fixation protein FixH
MFNMSEMKTHGRCWKYTIIALVALFVAAMIVSLSLAARKVSRVVDRDYYVHGLDYQREGEQLTNGVRLGWRLDAVYADGIMKVRATDGTGQPVSGGRVTLRNVDRLVTPQGGYNSATPSFTEESPGVYSASISQSQSGDVRRQVMVSRGNAAVASRLVILR